MVQHVTLHLFRRHVGHGAHHDAVSGVEVASPARSPHGSRRWAGDLGEPEIQHLDPPFHRDHDVGGFEIAVDDALVVGGGEGLGNAVPISTIRSTGRPPSGMRRSSDSPSINSITRKVTSDVATPRSVLSFRFELWGRHADARATRLSSSAGDPCGAAVPAAIWAFTLSNPWRVAMLGWLSEASIIASRRKRSSRSGVRSHFRRQDLERHLPAELGVGRTPHLPDPAGAEGRGDAVVSER